MSIYPFHEALENVSLSDMNLTKIPDDIKICKNLKKLSISSNNLSNLNEIAGLVNLEGLFICENKVKLDISAIKNLKNLEIVYIYKTPINNLKPFENCVNLKQLVAWKCGLTSLEGLGNCHKLKYLEVHLNSISDLQPIANLTQLKTLNIADNHITDFSVLKHLSISTLNISGNKPKLEEE